MTSVVIMYTASVSTDTSSMKSTIVKRRVGLLVCKGLGNRKPRMVRRANDLTDKPAVHGDRHKLGKKANYALITFRTEDQMQKLLNSALKGEGVHPREDLKAKWDRSIMKVKAGKLKPQYDGKLEKNWSIAAKQANEKLKSQRGRSATGAWRVVIKDTDLS